MTKASQSFTDLVESFIDWIVRIVVYSVIPIPLAAETIVQFRGLILTFLGNTVLLLIVFIFVLVQLFTSPLVTSRAQAQIALPVDGSFIETGVPLQNPLGGQGVSWVQITAGFMDSNYRFFGGIHTGVDFVPNDAYYQSSTAYKETGSVVVFSTINGTVNYHVDKYGSHTVEITNTDETTKIIFMHLNDVFVATGDTITAGKPIGTMGDTGFSTGEHLHYEVREKHNDAWVPVNPLGYIH